MNLRFENDVKIYGIKTELPYNHEKGLFENDVKIYGIKTFDILSKIFSEFENDVKIYGIKTIKGGEYRSTRLRMM